MSRKRVAPFRLHNTRISSPNIQVYQCEYYRPGCYHIPEVVHRVTPYHLACFEQWQPYCNTATYVVDPFGRADYSSDFEYQLQIPTSVHVQPNEVIYNFYNDGEAEISSLPHIEEEDYAEDHEVCVRKRKRLNNESQFLNKKVPILSKSYCEEFSGNNVYRSNEGYLVEEPNDNIPESVQNI